MNRKFSASLRGIALLTAILLMLPLFAACKKEQELTEGEPSLTVDEDGTVTFLLKLGATDLQAHAGQTAYLYELAPGESVSAINEKSAMLQNKVSSKIRFAFPVTAEDGTDRRCNTYLMTFSDGTIYSEPIPLSNPEALATNTEAFPNANGIKGMASVSEELARSLHSTHTLISLSASELLAGDVAASWNGVTVALNGALLERTDKQVSDAARAEMQISLELILDPDLSVATGAAVIDLLMERYDDAESGAVTALILKDGKPAFVGIEDDAAESAYRDSVERYAQLMRVAHTAMVSRARNGRVYFGADLHTEEMKSYVVDVYEKLKETVSVPFGVALYPLSLTESLLPEEPVSDERDGKLLLSDLTEAAEFFSDKLGKRSQLCILGLKISAEDPDLQSALYTYAFRAAQNAKADFLIYDTPVDDETGLYDSNGIPRPAAECFALADTSENLLGETLASNRLSEEWSRLNSIRPTRVSMEEPANRGVSDDLGKRYFDFSEGDPMGFAAAGNATAPAVVNSESWNTQVMMSAITTGAFGEASGFRCQVTEVKKLRNAHVLSANLLPQSSGAEEAEVTLLLEGTAADGRAISLRSSLTLPCNEWQAISFHVRGFTSLMDENAPCSVTLTMDPLMKSSESSEEEVHHALWLHSVNLRQAAPDLSGILLISIVAAGFGAGFSVVLILSAQKKKRQRRDQA